MYRPARRLADISPFHVVELMTRARQLESEGRDIIHMEIGEPDFPTPEPIARAARQAIAEGRSFYTQTLGLPELREAIAGFYRQRYGLDIPARRIAVTNGASGALGLAFACLADPGSEWLLTDPGYPCNRSIIRSSEGIPVAMPVGPESNYQPNLETLARHWTERTAGVLLASPANPTGTLLSADEIADLSAFVRDRQGHFLVDEIYQGLTYAPQEVLLGDDREEVPFRDAPQEVLLGDAPTANLAKAPCACAAGDDLWVIQSFSKYFQMTGWRLGWMVIPDPYVRDVEKLAQNLTLCPSTPAQYGALAAFLPETIAILESRRAEFQRRRDFLAPALATLGFRLTAKPQGAFYLYCDCSALTDNSFTFARDLLEKAGIAATPGLDFGNNQPEKHIRFAYTTGIDRLAEAVDRLGRFLG